MNTLAAEQLNNRIYAYSNQKHNNRMYIISVVKNTCRLFVPFLFDFIFISHNFIFMHIHIHAYIYVYEGTNTKRFSHRVLLISSREGAEVSLTKIFKKIFYLIF